MRWVCLTSKVTLLLPIPFVDEMVSQGLSVNIALKTKNNAFYFQYHRKPSLTLGSEKPCQPESHLLIFWLPFNVSLWGGARTCEDSCLMFEIAC